MWSKYKLSEVARTFPLKFEELLFLEICRHARFCACILARSITKIATVVELSSCMGDIQVLAPFVATWRAERSIDLERRPRLARRVDTGNQHIDQAWVDIQCYAFTAYMLTYLHAYIRRCSDVGLAYQCRSLSRLYMPSILPTCTQAGIWQCSR